MNGTDAAAVTHLYLVRHGATAANEREPPTLQGDGVDLPLNANGLRQAECAARLLAGVDVRQVYSSPLQRALQTAQAIAVPHGLTPRTDPMFREANVGEWEGLDWGTVERRDPQAHARFMEDPGRHPYLGGESYGDVWRRAQPAWETLLRRHAGEHIVLVAHNVVNRVLLAGLLGVELKRAKSIPQGNGCVNLVQGNAGRATLVTLNSLFHLVLCRS